MNKKHLKEEKRKKKKLKLDKEKNNLEQKQRYIKTFPSFRSEELDNNIDPSLVKFVEDYIFSLKLNDKNIFHPAEILFFKVMKKDGFSIAVKLLGKDIYKKIGHFRPNLVSMRKKINEPFSPAEINNYVSSYFTLLIGQLLFDILQTKNIFKNYFPQHDVGIYPSGRDFIILYKKLDYEKTAYGRRYFSKKSSQVKYNEAQYHLGFSTHSIRRLAERLVSNPNSYSGYADYWEVMHWDRRKLKIIPNYDAENIWIELFIYTINGSFGRSICDAIIGKNKGDTYYKAGYLVCGKPQTNNVTIPVKTILTQGMKDTPEYRFLKENKIDIAQRNRITKSLEDTKDFKTTFKTRNFEAWTFFHNNGIIQAF